MKKVLKFTSYSILSLLVFILAYLLVAFVLSRITISKEQANVADVQIFIKTNGVHTDLVVPVKTDLIDWSKEIKFSNTILKDTTMQFVALGWGDKGFYLETPQWADLKASVALNAAFGLGNTAIHATFYKEVKESESCRSIMISKEQYQRLINYLSGSFDKDAEGHFIPIITNANYGNTDAFYEATGSYSMIKTCNSWANKGLKEAGQKACLWTAFDTGIFKKYE